MLCYKEKIKEKNVFGKLFFFGNKLENVHFILFQIFMKRDVTKIREKLSMIHELHFTSRKIVLFRYLRKIR